MSTAKNTPVAKTKATTHPIISNKALKVVSITCRGTVGVRTYCVYLNYPLRFAHIEFGLERNQKYR